LQERYPSAALAVLVSTVVTPIAEAGWTAFGGSDAQNEPRFATDFGPILVAQDTMRR
jgi:hypothetical protein